MRLDESLICAFGCIKFKVRIFTKPAQYGINIYFVTDAETGFFLKVIIYTGEYNYYNNDNTDMLKTVKFVCEICNPFEVSYSTVFVGRFYNYIPLMK